METALNGVWDAELKAGDRVSIVGAGVVGCLAAFLAARHPGTEVELVDVDPTRASVAQAFGAKFSLPEEARTGADVVLHTSGVPQGLETALRLAGAEARVVELSWYGTESVSLPLGERFHPARLRIVGSQVGALPLSQRARWNHRRRLEKALELCKAPELDVLLHSESSLTDLPVAMAELVLRGGLCHRVNY
jgi:threonine dehydrogenase-like Zn-dependent dehydrogenase